MHIDTADWSALMVVAKAKTIGPEHLGPLDPNAGRGQRRRHEIDKYFAFPVHRGASALQLDLGVVKDDEQRVAPGHPSYAIRH
jgi:hypothetical protein